MTITLIILIITVAMFIWGKVRADIVALTALAALLVLFAHRRHDDRPLRGGWSHHADRSRQADGQ